MIKLKDCSMEHHSVVYTVKNVPYHDGRSKATSIDMNTHVIMNELFELMIENEIEANEVDYQNFEDIEF